MIPAATSSPPVTSPLQLITIDEVRRRVPVSRTTLWRWSRSGKFPVPVRIGARAFWREADIEAFLARLGDAPRNGDAAPAGGAR